MTDEAISEGVRNVVDTVIRPLIEADGGDIEIVRADAERIVLRLSRTCASCPGAHFTQTGVIEPAIRAKVGRNIPIEVLRGP